MSKRKDIFQGNVQIYLQGQNALIPVGEIREDQMTYFIGSKNSNILIRDFRQNPIFAAHKALSGLDGVEFASIFNSPAWIEIKDNKNYIQIDMHESSRDETESMLWIGIIDNDNIPVHYMSWEKFVNINNSTLAFAALVDD